MQLPENALKYSYKCCFLKVKTIMFADIFKYKNFFHFVDPFYILYISVETIPDFWSVLQLLGRNRNSSYNRNVQLS